MRGLTLSSAALVGSSSLRHFNPLFQVAALHAMWADDPQWANPGDGNAVTSWRNSSGGGDPASTGTNRPTFDAVNPAYNNRSTVHFVAASLQRLAVDTSNLAQPLKIVAVGDTGTLGVAERIVGIGGTAGNGLGDHSTDVWRVGAGANLTSVVASDNSPHVFRATLDGLSSQLWVDETSVAFGDAGTSGVNVLGVGAGVSNTLTFANYLDGDVAFVGVYAGATSDALLASLCDALQAYYGTP